MFRDPPKPDQVSDMRRIVAFTSPSRAATGSTAPDGRSEIPRISAHTLGSAILVNRSALIGTDGFSVKTESSPRILAEDTIQRVSID